MQTGDTERVRLINLFSTIESHIFVFPKKSGEVGKLCMLSHKVVVCRINYIRVHRELDWF